jgi:hypothetical protein
VAGQNEDGCHLSAPAGGVHKRATH